jgi:hypothetical protein
MVVAAVLDRVRDEDDEPIFLLKGGVAMELRLRLRARTTRDYGAALRARADEVLDLLDEALQAPYNNFTVTRDAPEDIRDTGAMRIRLRLAYKGRPWGSIQLELAPVEGQMGRELDRVEPVPVNGLQVPVPDDVACVSVRYQVAQKLHACTEVFGEGPENDRFRDVMDVLLVEDLIRDEVGSRRTRKRASTSSPCAPSTPGHRRSRCTRAGASRSVDSPRRTASSPKTSTKLARGCSVSSTTSTPPVRSRERKLPRLVRRGSGADVRPDDLPVAGCACPGTRVAEAARCVLAADRAPDREHDEGQGHITDDVDADVLLGQLGDLEDARAVRLEIRGLVRQAPVGTDGEQLVMEESVERLGVARAHRRLQRTLPLEHLPLRRIVAHGRERTGRLPAVRISSRVDDRTAMPN